MSYLPHSVRASTGALYGNIVKVRLEDLRPQAGQNGRRIKFPIYVNISLVNVPRGKKLYGLRYLGPLTLSAGGRSFSAAGDFDVIISDYLSDPNTDESQLRADVEACLSGRVVTPTNVGGRWIVQ